MVGGHGSKLFPRSVSLREDRFLNTTRGLGRQTTLLAQHIGSLFPEGPATRGPGWVVHSCYELRNTRTQIDSVMGYQLEDD